MAAASFISMKMGFITENQHAENINLLTSLNLPIKASNLNANDIKSLISRDKKGGTFVLLRGRHTLQTNIKVPKDLIDQALMEVIT